MAEQDNPSGKPSLMQIMGSVFAAAFGVQSDANRRRDFAQGTSATPYIVAGLIFTVIFIMAIVAVVKTVVG